MSSMPPVGDGFGDSLVDTGNWRGAGRPRKPVPDIITESTTDRASKLDLVYQYIIKDAGFRTFGDFLIEFLSNASPEIKSKRTRFFNSAGEQVMALMLRSSHGGQRKPPDTWPCLTSWLLDSTDKEITNFLKKDQYKQLLRHKERVKHGGLEATRKAATLAEFRGVLEQECPLSWQMLCKIGETTKEKTLSGGHDDSNTMDSEKHVPLNAMLSLLYCRNNQINAYPVSTQVAY
jgi:hypothetical protein